MKPKYFCFARAHTHTEAGGENPYDDHDDLRVKHLIFTLRVSFLPWLALAGTLLGRAVGCSSTGARTRTHSHFLLCLARLCLLACSSRNPLAYLKCVCSPIRISSFLITSHSISSTSHRTHTHTLRSLLKGCHSRRHRLWINSELLTFSIKYYSKLQPFLPFLATQILTPSLSSITFTPRQLPLLDHSCL